MSSDTLTAAQLDRLGRAMLETASDAVVFADREGVIRFWNPGAERQFGLASAQAVGQSLDIIIPEAQRAALGRLSPGDGKRREPLRARRSPCVPGLRGDGTRISLEFTIVPLHAADGRVDGVAAVLRDVTKRFEELRALRRELNAARASNKEKDP